MVALMGISEYLKKESQNFRPWRTWKRTARLALIAVLFTLLTYFVASNFILVDLHLLGFTLSVRLCWALLIASGFGFAIGLFMAQLKD